MSLLEKPFPNFHFVDQMGAKDGYPPTRCTCGAILVEGKCPVRIAKETPKKVWGYASYPDEPFSGAYDTREEAVEDGKDEFETESGHDSFYVIDGAMADVAAYLPDVEWIIEKLGENAYEEAGEIAEGYPEVSEEGKLALEELLLAWANKYAKPEFWIASGRAELIPEYKVVELTGHGVLVAPEPK